MNNLKRLRMILGLLLAISFGMVSYFGATAGPDDQTPPPEREDCRECHPTLYMSWEQSDHGQALVDPAFQEQWQEQGEPRECLMCHTTGYDPDSNTWVEDGISCRACHSPMPDNHPMEPMPTDRSAALCEQCHSQTVFEWNISSHRQSGLDCVDCHGQHTTTLRAEDVAELCAGCHRDHASTFAHSVHNEQDLSCPDCHLETLDGEYGGDRGHSVNDHSFSPKLDACNRCHSYQMHDPVDAGSEGDSPAMPETQGISFEPDPVNPLTFALLSALVGMAAGLVIAPWVQKWYQKIDFNIDSNDQEDK